MGMLSKSKLLAYRQCQRRLWLEIHDPDPPDHSAATEATFKTGHHVGEVARRIYDPKGTGTEIDRKALGTTVAIASTPELLVSNKPLFEAGFSAEGAYAFADVMLPLRKAGQRVWRMVEVKSSTEVKDYHRDDTAVQAFVARASGAPLASVAVAYIDKTWVYPGGEDYTGLFVEEDLTDEAFGRVDEVRGWISEAQAVVRRRKMPDARVGKQCTEPYVCNFIDRCTTWEPKIKYPVSWLPRATSSALKTLFNEGGVEDLRKVPDALLNERQLRVKTATLSGKPYFDKAGAAAELAAYKLPATFLDFETIQFAVPIWKGTRPYQKIPFQFSAQRLSRSGKLVEHPFLDLSGDNPSRKLAEALLASCGDSGPVFAYHASVEKGCITGLAETFPRMKRDLMAIAGRLVDLLPVAKKYFYHPSQAGSWSLKAVLPAVVPGLSYADLDEVQGGTLAMIAYAEAITPETSAARKATIEKQLLDYCRLDTYAMVRLWQVFAGRSDFDL